MTITFPLQDAIKQRLLGKPGHLSPVSDEKVMALFDSFKVELEGADTVVRFYWGDMLVGRLRCGHRLMVGDSITVSDIDGRVSVRLV